MPDKPTLHFRGDDCDALMEQFMIAAYHATDPDGMRVRVYFNAAREPGAAIVGERRFSTLAVIGRAEAAALRKGIADTLAAITGQPVHISWEPRHGHEAEKQETQNPA